MDRLDGFVVRAAVGAAEGCVVELCIQAPHGIHPWRKAWPAARPSSHQYTLFTPAAHTGDIVKPSLLKLPMLSGRVRVAKLVMAPSLTANKLWLPLHCETRPHNEQAVAI